MDKYEKTIDDYFKELHNKIKQAYLDGKINFNTFIKLEALQTEIIYNYTIIEKKLEK